MGKTYSLESCLWFLCGLDDESKHDPSIHDNTLKSIAGLTTNPVAVDDGESTTKVKSILNITLSNKIKSEGREVGHLCF